MTAPSNHKALRLPAVIAKTGISRSHIFRLMQRGSFPKSCQLSERVSVWDEAAIDAWLAEKFSGRQS
jgi:prophage regulatory protein